MDVRDPASKSRRSLNDLPHEVLLEVIAGVEYDPRNLSALCLTNRLFHDLMITHQTSLIRKIARQQFPLESMCTTSAWPSKTWLCHLSSHRLWIYDLLNVSRELGLRESRGLERPSLERYNQWATVGVHLSVYVRNRYYSTGNDDFETAAAILRSGIATLPMILLLHLYFALFIFGKFVPRYFRLDRYDRLLYEYGNNLGSLVPSLAKYCSKEFCMGVSELICQNGANGRTMVINMGLKKEIERRLGHEDVLSEDQLDIDPKKLNAKDVHAAMIRALQKETLSDKDVAQMLAGM